VLLLASLDYLGRVDRCVMFPKMLLLCVTTFRAPLVPYAIFGSARDQVGGLTDNLYGGAETLSALAYYCFV
jgi:hypothetical protein